MMSREEIIITDSGGALWGNKGLFRGIALGKEISRNFCMIFVCGAAKKEDFTNQDNVFVGFSQQKVLSLRLNFWDFYLCVGMS